MFAAFYIGAFLAAASSLAASLISHLSVTGLTWLFWLAGAAAQTANTTGGLSCGQFDGAHCHQLNASLAFAWIECKAS